MNRARLLHTARNVLPYVPTDKFDMGVWGKRTACGTAACAFGSEALTKYANRQGLKLRRFDGTDQGSWDYLPVFQPRGKPYSDGLHAAAFYYDIDYDLAYWLFSPLAYDTQRIPAVVVAERIENVLGAGVDRYHFDQFYRPRQP